MTVKATLNKWHEKTAALIYGDDDQFTKTDADIFRTALDNDHVTLVDTETFHKKDVDFEAQLTKIKALHPDVLVLGALAEEGAKIMAQARKLGITAHFMGGNGLNSPKIGQLAGDAANGVVVGAAWFINSNQTGNRSFVSRYTQRFGTPPDQFAAQAYAAIQILAEVVGNGGATTRADLCAGLKNLRVAKTVLGPVAFAPSRDVNGAPVILELTPKGFDYFK